MTRADPKQLVNLSLGKKVFFSLALLITLGLFFSALFYSVFLTHRDFYLHQVITWGKLLKELCDRRHAIFHVLFAAHALSLSLACLLFIAGRPRREKAAEMGGRTGPGVRRMRRHRVIRRGFRQAASSPLAQAPLSCYRVSPS